MKVRGVLLAINADLFLVPSAGLRIIFLVLGHVYGAGSDDAWYNLIFGSVNCSPLTLSRTPTPDYVSGSVCFPVFPGSSS